jgi:hypothetical protein
MIYDANLVYCFATTAFIALDYLFTALGPLCRLNSASVIATRLISDAEVKYLPPMGCDYGETAWHDR